MFAVSLVLVAELKGQAVELLLLSRIPPLLLPLSSLLTPPLPAQPIKSFVDKNKCAHLRLNLKCFQ